MKNLPAPDRERLIIPGLAGLYDNLANLAETILRVFSGLALVTHGWPKIQDPMSRVGLVESVGFAPAEFWAVMLACTEFFGGILIALGLLTRPAAVGALIVLLVAGYWHWGIQGQGYSGAEKALLWAAIMFFFVGRGANRYSLDALLKKSF